MQNIRAIFMVIFAMAAFTIEDGVIKALSADLPTNQIITILGLGGSMIFGLFAWHSGHRLLAPAVWTPLPISRALSEAIGAITFITALSLIDLSIIAAVFQAVPLVVTMGAALFLGETVGWRRWSAVIVGFLGVLIIIRPGFAGFQPAALIVLITVMAIAARDLITRKINVNVSSTVISFQGFAAVAVAGICLLIFQDGTFKPLNLPQSSMALCAILSGTAGYYGIVSAMRIGEPSAIMPFRYIRLVFSIIVSVIVFHERPDFLTLLGAGLILSTGLYTFLREHKLSRQAQHN